MDDDVPKQEIITGDLVDQDSGEDLEPDPTVTMHPEKILEAIPKSVIQWVMGEVQEQPAELASTMDSVAEKINMGIAYLIVQRLATLSKSIAYSNSLMESLVDPDRMKGMSAKDRMADFRTITKEANEFMEFTRKFTLQNREMFSRKSQADRLAELLRELDPKVVQVLLKILGRKGAGTTVNDLVRTFQAPGAEPPKPKPTGDPLFQNLMGEDPE